jgi:cytochrome c oxidase subunit 2
MLSVVLQAGLVPRGTRVEVFQRIYWVFLALGALVGVVVISYMLWKAYKYRDGVAHEGDDVDRPQLGEIPTGGGGGRKLFLSFGLSTIIVVSLIVWTYGTLLYVESDEPIEGEDLDVEVVGYQFGWDFVYPNGHTSSTLRVPAGQEIRLTVTSDDVFHNFGIPELRVKTDAIPGQTTNTWFAADEPGEYTANCYELCGTGHSYMTADVIVMPQDEFESWYAETTPAPETATPTESGGHGGNEGGEHA